MTARTVKILAIAVIVLFAAVFALNSQRDKGKTADELLFPGLKDRIDDIGKLTVADADGEVTIERKDDRWIVPGKGGYEANTDALRQLLLAVADARKVEEKTSNPEWYERLGVRDPTEEGSTAVLVSSAGLGELDFSLILGKPVQREYRYVRIAGQPQSWLVDQNPEIPDDSNGWLSQDIVDIESSRIQSVTITHDDGETIYIHKDDADSTNFEVEDVPEGRELSYPSVANGIAAVLSNLTLDDVVADTEPGEENVTTTVFTTFDGLRIGVASTAEDDRTWITLAASATPPSDDVTPSGSGDAVTAAPEENEPAAPAEEEQAHPEEEAADINALVSGWKYRISDYKANQLTRRWDDLLKAEE